MGSLAFGSVSIHKRFRMTPQALNTLVLHQQRFLSFLERRLGNRAAAEEVLQAAFLRGIEKGESLRDEESVVAWFYRLLATP